MNQMPGPSQTESMSLLETQKWHPLQKPSSSPYSLKLCLNSGQTFGWSFCKDAWVGTIGDIAYALKETEKEILFQSSSSLTPDSNTHLSHYLALSEEHEKILRTFPNDPFLQLAVNACPGLRILRQDPWECLAGFILSSSKQIPHIQQIWKKLCLNWGSKREIHPHLILPRFPTAAKLAQCSEMELRQCAMGFRAPYLLEAARRIHEKRLDLEHIKQLPLREAREKLTTLPGVGRKIADCVLLFSLGKTDAFPVDTWILKVLKKIYFPRKRKVSPRKLLEFTDTHFGPYAGHAQQYLFHYARMHPEMFQ